MESTSFVAFFKFVSNGPQEGFPTADSTLDVPEAFQVLLLAPMFLSFAAAIRAFENGKQQNSSESRQHSQVKLVRADAIALGFAIAGCSIVFLQSIALGYKMLPHSPRGGFPTSDSKLEVPQETQLLLISCLLFVFLGMVKNAEDDAKANCEHSTKASQVALVRTEAIAVRLAFAVGTLGLIKTLTGSSLKIMSSTCARFASAFPASPKEGFPSSTTTSDVPEGIQILVVSVLILVFAFLVRSAETDTKREQGERKGVRLAFAVGTLGLIKTLTGSSTEIMSSTCTRFAAAFPASPKEGFPSSSTTSDVPEGIQLLAISFLILVFAYLVGSAEADPKNGQSERKQNAFVELLRSLW